MEVSNKQARQAHRQNRTCHRPHHHQHRRHHHHATITIIVRLSQNNCAYADAPTYQVTFVTRQLHLKTVSELATTFVVYRFDMFYSAGNIKLTMRSCSHTQAPHNPQAGHTLSLGTTCAQYARNARTTFGQHRKTTRAKHERESRQNHARPHHNRSTYAPCP